MSFSKPTYPTCENCKFAYLVDYGYSNYTVEGTTFYCLANKHPKDGFDRFYGEEDQLKYAVECPSFTNGEAIHMDVDGEGESELTPEQRELLDGKYYFRT